MSGWPKNETSGIDAGVGKGLLSSVVSAFDPQLPACEQALDLGLVRKVYPDAIEIGMQENWGRGLALTLYVMAWFTLAPFAIWMITWFWESEFYRGVYVLGGVAVAFFVFFGFLISIHELFGILSNTVLFDRTNRQVCIKTLDVSRGWFRGRRAGQTECYDWDQIQVEHRALTNITSASVFRTHYLILKVPNPAHPELEILPMGALTELTAPAFYEFLRRYMQENGPPLTQGDQVLPSGIPQSWMDSVRMATPFGPNYKQWCRDPIFFVFFHLLLPVAIPFFLLRVVCHHVCFRTAIKVDWSSAVKAQIGPPLNERELPVWMAQHYPPSPRQRDRVLHGRRKRYQSRFPQDDKP